MLAPTSANMLPGWPAISRSSTPVGGMIGRTPFPLAMSSPIYPPEGYPPLPANVSLTENTRRSQARTIEKQALDKRQLFLYNQAVLLHQSALKIDPTYTDAWFNLAETYAASKRYPQAIEALSQLLLLNPQDHDARVVLAGHLEKLGRIQQAKSAYQAVLAQEPHFDPAKRKLGYLEFQALQAENPAKAQSLWTLRLTQVLKESKAILAQYYTSQNRPYMIALADTSPIMFEPTRLVGQSTNQAEYDHTLGVIRVEPEMLFGYSNVVAAYLAHEFEHRKDMDGLTSEQEEQDGYMESAKLWSAYKDTVIEPNLDKALQLYSSDLQAFKNQISMVYRRRDPGIASYSPGHGIPYPKTPQESAMLAQALATQRAQNYQQLLNTQQQQKLSVSA